MPVYRNISDTWKSVTPWRKISGTWKSCIQWRNISGTWKQLNSFMTASASPAVVGVTTTAGSTVTVTSDATTATPSGGTGPYSYLWQQVGGDAMTITSPTSASTTFSESVPNGTGYVGYFTCTITDSLTAMATTNNVECSLSND